MKTYAFALVVLVAGVNAMPNIQQLSNERWVSGTIRDIVEDLSNKIKERGLDPYHYEGFTHELAVSDILYLKAVLAEVFLKGLSNMKINDVDYSVIFSRLRIDISLPLIFGGIGQSEGKIQLVGIHGSGRLSGEFAIKEIRFRSEVRISIGIISGISVRSVVVNFTINDIKSNFVLVIFGYDLSESINTIISSTVPETLRKYNAQINEALAQLILQVLENVL